MHYHPIGENNLSFKTSLLQRCAAILCGLLVVFIIVSFVYLIVSHPVALAGVAILFLLALMFRAGYEGVMEHFESKHYDKVLEKYPPQATKTNEASKE